MTIREDIAVLHAIKSENPNQTALTAINDAISALMTIEDMSFYGIPPVKKEPVPAGFDLKTLYEQITAFFDKIADRKNEIYDIEVFQQPDTPILAYAYWNKTRHILEKITFTN